MSAFIMPDTEFATTHLCIICRPNTNFGLINSNRGVFYELDTWTDLAPIFPLIQAMGF